MKKHPAVIFDIDGTIADCSHRRHFVEGERKNFRHFYEAMDKDVLNKPVYELHKMVANMPMVRIIFCTSRPERYRKITKKWLHSHDVFFDWLYMRSDEQECDRDCDVKITMLKDIQQRFDILFVVDDRQRVVDMWRENGIACFQVAEGDF